MAISTEFNTAYQVVAPTQSITYVSGAGGHSRFQYSYSWNGSGYTVSGGSDLACQHGASMLLEDLGFRFYSPDPLFHKYPSTIATDKSASLQQYAIPLANIIPSPFYSWSSTYLASRAPYQTADTKYRTLNGVARTISSGHRWGSIIASSTLASFWAQAENAALLYTNSGGNLSINLEIMTRGSADWTRMVNVCAQWLLRDSAWVTGITDYEYHDFDAPDGDDNTSDKVFPFASDVALACRSSSVAAVGPYSEITTVTSPATRPNALLGLYSYANHKVAPSTSCPGLYVAVALAYNDSGFTAAELLTNFAAKVDLVGMREYYDVFDWSFGQPMSNIRAANIGLDYMEDLLAAGFSFANGQNTANWLYNIVMNRRYVMTYRSGTVYPYSSALSDIVEDIFGGDQAVYNLYNFWADYRNKNNKWSLVETFNYINAMQAGWYKTRYQKLAVILYEQMFLPVQMVDGVDADWNTANDPFPAALEKLYRHVLGVRDDWILDCYEFLGDLSDAGGRAYWRPNYPALQSKMSTSGPYPTWWFNPLVPTEGEFNSYYADLLARPQRDAEFDDSDLVIVRGITAESNAGDATGFASLDTGIAYAVVGPATVTVTRESVLGPADPDTGIRPTIPGGVEYPDYSEHKIYPSEYLPYEATVECSGGLLFMDWLVITRRNTTTTGTVGNANYIYLPERIDGRVNIYTIQKFRVVDAAGTHDIVSENAAGYDADEVANLGPGQVRVVVAETANDGAVYVGNRYISMYDDIALMPRVLADEDFPRKTFIKRGS